MGQVAMAKAEGALVSAMMAVAARLMVERWMLEEMASVAAAWQTVLSVMAEVKGAAALALAVVVRLMVVTVALVLMAEVEGASALMVAAACWIQMHWTEATAVPVMVCLTVVPLATCIEGMGTMGEGMVPEWALVGQVSSRMATSMLTQLRQRRFC